MPAMHLYRGDGGRLAEHWGVRDGLTARQQVGAIPTAPPPAMTPAES
jgi:hypothetical protein